MATATLAVIGGSGFYQMEGITEVEEVNIATPFGRPSDAIVVGSLEGTRVAFLPRHGRGHRLSPSEVNYRANIFALKTLGVERIISISACGSMREGIRPLDVVVPDQLFDRTCLRPRTFFGSGLVVHVGFANPFCPEFSEFLLSSARKSAAEVEHRPTVHSGGTYICIEGPQFSTRAESRVYRQWGVDLIGMTAIPEAKLAREAEICYAALAFDTDYDVWHVSEETVSVEMVVRNLTTNVTMAKGIIRSVARRLAAGEAAARRCECESALATSIITQSDSIPEPVKRDLAPLVGRYLPVRSHWDGD